MGSSRPLRETPIQWIRLGFFLLLLAGTACGRDPVPAEEALTPSDECMNDCALACEDEQGGNVNDCVFPCVTACLCEVGCILECRD